MKTKHKALLLAACAVLLMVASVLGTMAYLTSTEAVVNTFTVGSVEIKLDETAVNEDGTAKDPASRTEDGNQYHLLPGHTYIKDPTVSILEGSESSYIRLIVKVEGYSKLTQAFPKEKYPTWYDGENFLLQYLVEGWNPEKWLSTEIVTVEEDVASYEFRYFEPVAGLKDDGDNENDDIALDPLFTEIKVPGTVTNVELKNLQQVEIKVEAHAIQAAGFENDVADAWEAFGKQHP